jgi:alkylation response protein AidB-like acyl-CoA dehydrogenase
MSSMAAGQPPGKESSVLKLVSTDLEQDVAQAAMEIPGYRALGGAAPDAGDGMGEFDATCMPRYLNARAASIYGGSNEIQRSIIAGQVLGLR